MNAIRILLAAGLGLSAAAADAAGQSVTIPVPVNTHQINDGSISNPDKDPLTLIALCGATNGAKTVEGWVKRNVADPPQLVASTSGMGRLSITFVVPRNWHFWVVINPASAGGACTATAWWTE